MKSLEAFLDWSEVWALLIPLAILIFFRPKGMQVRWLTAYVIAGLVLNTLAIFMLEFYYLVPDWAKVRGMANNNIFYNLHSFTRALLLSQFILSIRVIRFQHFLRALLVFYILLVIVNFTFVESPFFLSTHLFTAESVLLLIMCLSYFFSAIQDESNTNWLRHPAFLVCAGTSLYEVITFFIFLFFYPLSLKDADFFTVTMRVYIAAFILFCLFLSWALYRYSKAAEKQELTTVN